MPNDNTKIKLKRTTKPLSQLISNNEPLQYGEPAFVETINGKNHYLAIGNNNVEGNNISGATYFEGIINPDYLGKTVYANASDIAVIQSDDVETYPDGKPVATSKIATKTASPTPGVKYYLLSCRHTDDETPQDLYVHHIDDQDNSGEEIGLYISENVLHGGAWNDYAEQRVCIQGKPGQVVCETGLGVLDISEFKLQPLPYVISDTYGIIIGPFDENSKPVAVAGRVLVYVDCEVSVGDVLCAGEKGFATKMTRQEIINYPDRILGIVSEIPTYDTWNDKEVDGRIWITMK